MPKLTLKEKTRVNLKEQLGLKNINAVPLLEKISLNVGIGSLRGNQNIAKIVQQDLALITGQKPIERRAKKAIAGFKVRQGETIGLSVTLRGNRMYDFLSKLTNVVLPRIRDFRGLTLKKFDRSGNYTFGIKEHLVFPEIEHETVSTIYGLSISLTTTAKDRHSSELLLKELGLPFKASSITQVTREKI